MKTLFFIAALTAAVYLIMQTPAGKSWIANSKAEVNLQPEMTKQDVIHTADLERVEKKVNQMTQSLYQQQQVQVKQLESRIAELENELIMGRIAQKQASSVVDGEVTLHPYNQQPAAVQQPFTQKSDTQNTAPPKALAVTQNKQLQQQRQARLQDIADKMEISSLQALVN